MGSAASASMGMGGGAFDDYGGVDPSMDPELAMAIRASTEEARAQEEARVSVILNRLTISLPHHLPLLLPPSSLAPPPYHHSLPLCPSPYSNSSFYFIFLSLLQHTCDIFISISSFFMSHPSFHLNFLLPLSIISISYPRSRLLL
jgi:hypothetical protein